MTVWLKQDVSGFIHPRLGKAESKIHIIYQSYEEDLYITSHREGKHGMISLHPYGYAIDFRKPKETPVDEVVERIRKTLGKDFDIVVEASHIHLEYDPK